MSSQSLPDWASPPGATISDLLEERGQSEIEFAQAMELTLEAAKQLLTGSIQITDEIAQHLARFFGVSASFWLSREAQFREGLEHLAGNEVWVKKLPVNDLIKFGWVRNTEAVHEKIAACLTYFGVPTVADWYQEYEGRQTLAAFRTSQTLESDEGAVLAWLRKGEIDGAAMDCRDWDPDKLRASLLDLRALTREKDPAVFIPALQERAAECGIALVIARTLSGCRASGATKFLSENRPLMMLSFRYLTDDHFWFTFFHEVGHLLLHDIREVFLEDGDYCTGKEEDEANAFAAELLIPPEHQAEMRSLPVDGRAVMRFARKIGISPGIVVGQLQFQGYFTQRQLNNLKVRYSWTDN